MSAAGAEPAVRRVLVLGATGYVGGRLVPRLLEAGYEVRVVARDPARLDGRPWRAQVHVVRGDALHQASLAPAFEGMDVAYHLIHSMTGGESFHDRDLVAARNVGALARAAGTRRLIYVGGLGDPDSKLSEHLRSRQDTGRALGEAGVPVTEFRAGVIVGSGSLSFEMIRDLAERLPVMICPRWVYTRAQPIAIRTMLDYLVAALQVDESAGKAIEIGGADVLSYAEMMQVYARVRGLKRLLIAVPVLTPRLSSYWVHWMTPVSARVARPLIEGLRNEVVVRDDTAQRLFPEIVPLGYEEAVERALQRLREGQVSTAWSDAQASGGRTAGTFEYGEGMFRERREREVAAPPDSVFSAFTGIGGERGYPSCQFLWRLRGMLDRLVGGVGFRRGRRDPDRLRVGDALDFWRVEVVEPGRLLRLRAEMKVPGGAWLEFRSEPLQGGRAKLVQTAFFAPKGVLGFLYWAAMYPFHGPIFSRMIERLALRAEQSPAVGTGVEPAGAV